MQYGDSIKTLSSILTNEGMVSVKRTADIINNLSEGKLDISEGTIVNFNNELAEKAETTVEKIKEHLIKSKVLCVDESGVRINGKLHWIHTATTEDEVLFAIDKKRGTEATDNIGILTFYVGILMHDHLKSYYN